MDVERTGKRLSVALTFAVGILSVITGIVYITYTPVIGPLEPYVPPAVRDMAGFTGALTGFVMMLGAYGLTRGYRVAWYTTTVLLPITALQGVIQSSPLSLPLIFLSLVSIPLLVINRKRFDAPIALSSSQIAAGITLIAVQVYGTVGAYSLRDQFAELDTILDAFYFTLVTASTVGYGDISATTQVARLFAMSVLLFGTASFAVAIGVLLGPVIEARLAASLGRARGQQLELLEGHVVVLGYGELTEPIISELVGRAQFVVVTRKSESASELSDRAVTVLNADPSDEAVLERAQVDDAAVAIAATNDDANDAFALLTARELSEDLRIVATATNSDNVSKLYRAGADVVLDPAHVGAQLLVDAAWVEQDHRAR